MSEPLDYQIRNSTLKHSQSKLKHMKCKRGVVFSFRTEILMKNLLKTASKPLQLQIPDFEVPEAEIDGLAAKLHHTRVSKRVWIDFDCVFKAPNLRNRAPISTGV